jgi:ATP-binding cassette subfamily B protein
MAAFRQLAGRHTALVIAHRLSTIVDADRIVVIDRGAVIEEGTHASLLAASGKYAELWQIQLRAQA